MDQAVLVEKDRRAQVVIQENIAMTKSPEQFQLLKMEANRALEQLTGRFDLVLLDPPYAKEEIVKQIQIMDSKGLLGDDIVIVIVKRTNQLIYLKKLLLLGYGNRKFMAFLK